MLTIVELAPFRRRMAAHLIPDEFGAFTQYIAQKPTAGALIQGTGGWRKVRWATKGKGKSGGVRIVTFFRATHRVYLGAIYGKSDKAALTAAEKAMLKKLTESLE